MARVAKLRARALGSYPRAWAACRILRSVSSDTAPDPFMALDTVEGDTPAFSATSRMVDGMETPPAVCYLR